MSYTYICQNQVLFGGKNYYLLRAALNVRVLQQKPQQYIFRVKLEISETCLQLKSNKVVFHMQNIGMFKLEFVGKMGKRSKLINRYWVSRETGGNMGYLDTKCAKCRHLKKIFCNGFFSRCLSVFIDRRYSQKCWYFQPSFVNCCPSNFLSGSTLPPRFSVSKNADRV